MTEHQTIKVGVVKVADTEPVTVKVGVPEIKYLGGLDALALEDEEAAAALRGKLVKKLEKWQVLQSAGMGQRPEDLAEIELLKELLSGAE